MVRAHFAPRHRLHHVQAQGTSRFTLDKAHARMKKFGSYSWLLSPFLQLDAYEFTTHVVRLCESRSFILMQVNMNTQQQSARGIPTHQIVQ